MMSLNPFVENNKARINQFLDNLCEVGDFYESLEVSRCRPRLFVWKADFRCTRWINIWLCRRKT